MCVISVWGMEKKNEVHVLTWAHLGTFALSLSNGTKFGFTAPTKQID